MIARILSNLRRQERAVALLEVLQKEEFSHLSVRDPGAVASVEFSIQELMRQLAGERASLHQAYAAMDPAAKRLADVIDRFDADSAAAARVSYRNIEAAEKRCALQASQNYSMALGLYDVTKNSMDNLQRLLVPQKGLYGASGRMATGHPGPGVISGRF